MSIYNFKGYLSFPQIFTPDFVRNAQGKPSGEKKRYSTDLFFPPGDPQIPVIADLQNIAIANAYPSGAPANLRKAFVTYKDKFFGKSYYDPKFDAWYVLTLTAKETDKPSVVNMDCSPVQDPAKAYPGCEAWVACGISSYSEGTGGIGGWLNGVMLTGGESPVGRFDNRPSVEQMFANVGAQQSAPAAPGVPAAQFPPAGWTLHPTAPGFYYCGQEVLSEADLKARFPSAPAAPAIPSVPQPPKPPAVPSAPAIPGIPQPPKPPVPPAVPSAPAQFPPAGWTLHPQAPGYYYCGQEVLSEADLCARFGIVKPSFV